MHVVSFGVVMLILGASASVFIGVLLVSILHLFGYRSTYHFGVWTLMDALVVDLFLISGTVTLVVWPLISSSFIFCLKHASSFMKIDPYKLPSFTYGANELAITLQHAPIFAKNVSISLKSLQIMTAKSSFIAFAVFSFIVMPTCSFVTVFREQRLGSLETAPLTCGAMFPEHAMFWADMDAAAAKTDKIKIFESLCWKFTDLIWFTTAWSAVLGALLAFASTLTVAIQFGSSKDLN